MFKNLFRSRTRIAYLENKTQNIEALVEMPSIVEKLTKLVKKLEARIGKQELMHVDVFKKQNELFESAMNTLIKESGNFNRYALDYAANQIDKVKNHCEEVIKDEIDEENSDAQRPWDKIDFTLNGITCSVFQPGIVSYEELIRLACDPFPPRSEVKFSVEYSLAGGEKQEGTLIFGETIEIVLGTVVDVMGI